MNATLRGVALLIGLACYGLSMAMMVRAGLGLDPWDVFHQGLTRHTSMSIGVASAVVGVVVLLAWIPLRNKPGIGTIVNVIVIAITVDAGLAVLSAPESMGARIAVMLGAVVLNAVATVLYVGAGLGPGPRDGLMTGLVARSGLSVRLVRTAIEATVLSAGWLLGGSVGLATGWLMPWALHYARWNVRTSPRTAIEGTLVPAAVGDSGVGLTTAGLF